MENMNLTPESKVLIQGITESPASTRAALMMKAYGTNVVAGISPGQGGQNLEGIPIFDLVEQALDAVGHVDTSVIFVRPYWVLDAAIEAIAAGIRQIAIVTEGVPPLDMVRLVRKAEATETLVVGPNSPGIVVPDKLLLGTHPKEFYTPGSIGVISRSSTLTYEVALELTLAGLGQSIGVCIGCDAIVGSSFMQWLQILDEDDGTEAMVLIGEVGGWSEQAAASYIAEAIDKPVIAYLAGRYAPKGPSLGHASMLIGSRAAAEAAFGVRSDNKLAAFEEANIPVAARPSEVPKLVKKLLGK
jgi:succinyl-CoA synthetase alpha subunit